MRGIHKLIFRLDFNTNFKYIDNIGKAASLLTNTDKKLWNHIGESVEMRSLRAEYLEKGLRREINIDPSCINGVFETFNPVSLEQISESESFRGFNKVIERFCSEFEINLINRAGLRLTLFEDYEQCEIAPLDNFKTIINPDFYRAYSNHIGDAEDIAMVFEGKTKDEISYRLAFGNYHQNDILKVFSIRPDEQELINLEKNHITVDFDLYEKNFTFNGLNLMRWSKDKWPVVNSFMDDLKKNLILQGEA